MSDVHSRPQDSQDGASALDALNAALLSQLDELQGTLQSTSTHALANALHELQGCVADLLTAPDGSLSASSRRSLESIAQATGRIERVRTEMLETLGSSSAAEVALRRWTNSAPGDPRQRPQHRLRN